MAKKKTATKKSTVRGAKSAGKKRAPASRRGGSRAALQDYCRGLPGTTEDIKWGNDLMFSIGKKIYAGFGAEESEALAFKCDDDDFDRLTKIDGIIPAPYAARFGWVSVERDGVLSEAELKGLIRKSYELVREKLARKVKDGLPPVS